MIPNARVRRKAWKAFRLSYNYPVNQALDDHLNDLLSMPITDITQGEHEILIVFQGLATLRAWNANRFYAWLHRGSIAVSGKEVFTWYEARPRAKTLVALYAHILAFTEQAQRDESRPARISEMVYDQIISGPLSASSPPGDQAKSSFLTRIATEGMYQENHRLNELLSELLGSRVQNIRESQSHRAVIKFTNGVILSFWNANYPYAWMTSGSLSVDDETLFSWDHSRPSPSLMWEVAQIMGKREDGSGVLSRDTGISEYLAKRESSRLVDEHTDDESFDRLIKGFEAEMMRSIAAVKGSDEPECF
jgi:hypothetical protein